MKPTILVVVTDGRQDYMEATMASAQMSLRGEDGQLVPFITGIIVDDSGDPTYTDWLEGEYPGFFVFAHEQRQGLAAAVQTAWRHALEMSGWDYLFHLEGDFTFNEPVILPWLQDVFEEQPLLAEVTLQRQPWSVEELNRGSIFDNEEDWTQHAHEWKLDPEGKKVDPAVARAPGPGGRDNVRTSWWVEHQRIFSLNPSIIPRRIIEMGWPDGNEKEMTEQVVAAGNLMAFWGVKNEAAVTHIGETRAQGWKE